MADQGWTYIFYTFFAFLIIAGSKKLSVVTDKETHQKVISFSNIYTFLFIIFYSLIIGLRYNVGRDYMGYLSWLKELEHTGVYPTDNEIGFQMLNRLIVYAELHFSFLFIIIAFLQFYFLIFALKKLYFLRGWYLFFFFTTLIFFVSMNGMRQTIAYFVFFASLIFFLEKKYFQFVLLALLAFLFHKSVFVPLLFCPIVMKDWTRNKILQLVILVLSVFVLPLFIDKLLGWVSPLISLLGYNYYIEHIDYMADITKENAAGDGLSIYLFFIIDFIIIQYSDKLKHYFKKFHFLAFYNYYFIGLILSRIFANNFILARIAEYFIHFRALVLAFLCFYLIKNRTKGNKTITNLIIGFIIISMSAFFYKAILNNAANCSPFQFVFE